MGKGARRKQSGTMNEMNDLAQQQFEYFQGQQAIRQEQVDRSRGLYEDFQFTNPFANLQNPYADLQNPFADL